jgi:hypothetical protein
MWRRFLIVLLVLAISAVPLLIGLLEFAVIKKGGEDEVEFYKSIIPAIGFLGITIALVSISDYAEFRERHGQIYYHSKHMRIDMLPLTMFLIYLLLMAEFILYYQVSAYSAWLGTHKERADLVIFVRLFRSTTYSKAALCILYITQMTIEWDVKTNREIFNV